ncbi:MAG: hypothetical protein L6Q98_23505 [Anaerolineae bacterium]|nr:hypothetical protein [Anaerolineae bacterium]NUQ06379.1 hypothetical protein [Anaerolineae bacterium]
MDETIRSYLAEFDLVAAVGTERHVITERGQALINAALRDNYQMWAEYEALRARGFDDVVARMFVLMCVADEGVI